MSMKSWSEDGYGYPLLTGDNLNAIKDFIISNKNDPKVINSEPETSSLVRTLTAPDFEENLKACEDEYEMNDVLDEPLPWMIAKIINALEETTCVMGYDSCGDTNTEMHIGVSKSYPWYMNEKDKTMTENDAKKLLEKYAKLLNITEEPDYFDLEYFG